jgi:hypothetical protein
MIKTSTKINTSMVRSIRGSMAISAMTPPHPPQRAWPEDDRRQRENDDDLPYRKKMKHPGPPLTEDTADR